MRSFSAYCKEEMDAPTDAQGRILHTFTMSISDHIAELIETKDMFDTVEVTLTDEDPYKVLLRFHVAVNS